ncbi:helix-turn-helix transcriptional regulator [Thioclava sp. GXIMD4216]|uniref:response regulator transcription factor n=1 Tax=Thioclava sp. GXIMD4216 TaxID=3131929 RepID=UPI0030CABC19
MTTITLLSPAESRVLPLIALPYKEAAHRLNLSEPCIKMHIRQIARKLGARDRYGAIALATRFGVEIEIRRPKRPPPSAGHRPRSKQQR